MMGLGLNFLTRVRLGNFFHTQAGLSQVSHLLALKNFPQKSQIHQFYNYGSKNTRISP